MCHKMCNKKKSFITDVVTFAMLSEIKSISHDIIRVTIVFEKYSYIQEIYCSVSFKSYMIHFFLDCGNDTLCAAFSVGRNASQGTGIVFYNVVILNDGNGFDVVTSSFAAPVSGLYWLASSSGVEIATKSDQYLVGVDRLSRLTVSSATNNGIDTVSRDGLFYLSDQCSDVQVNTLCDHYNSCIICFIYQQLLP